jgi:hypothetical protein
VLFIHDIGDGGSKTDKFARDIGLLKEGWTSVPTTTGIYSTANSYKDYGKYDDAISYYKSRIGVGGWAEECGCATTTSGTAINY